MKRKILIGAGSFGLALVLLAGAVALYHRPGPCTLPCEELGKEPVPGRDKLFAPACDPIKLTLELEKPEAKIKDRYSLWHRVTIKNDCCRKIETQLPFFLGVPWAGDLYFRVWGPDGKEIAPDAWYPYVGSVIPYQVDYMRNKEFFDGQEGDYYTMSPAEEITANPAVLKPYLMVDTDSIEDLMKKHPEPEYRAGFEKSLRERERIIAKKMKELDPRDPPEGYRPLERFVFEKPGRFRIQAVFSMRGLISPPITWRRALPEPLKGLSELPLFLLDRLPDDKSHWYQLQATSKVLDFEVVE